MRHHCLRTPLSAAHRQTRCARSPASTAPPRHRRSRGTARHSTATPHVRSRRRAPRTPPPLRTPSPHDFSAPLAARAPAAPRCGEHVGSRTRSSQHESTATVTPPLARRRAPRTPPPLHTRGRNLAHSTDTHRSRARVTRLTPPKLRNSHEHTTRRPFATCVHARGEEKGMLHTWGGSGTARCSAHTSVGRQSQNGRDPNHRPSDATSAGFRQAKLSRLLIARHHRLVGALSQRQRPRLALRGLAVVVDTPRLGLQWTVVDDSRTPRRCHRCVMRLSFLFSFLSLFRCVCPQASERGLRATRLLPGCFSSGARPVVCDARHRVRQAAGRAALCSRRANHSLCVSATSYAAPTTPVVMTVSRPRRVRVQAPRPPRPSCKPRSPR